MDLSEQTYLPDFDYLEKKKDVESLIKALNHENYLVRKGAAISLKNVGDERAVDALIKALKYEKWQDEYTVLIAVRENSAEALGLIGDKRAVKPLIDALTNDVDEEVRWKSASALGIIGDHSAVEPLINALKDESWTVRRNVVSALGDIGDERAFEPLLQALEDEDWHVRKYVAVALGKMGDERAIDPLVKTLNDADADVRWKAIIALGDIGEKAFEPLLNVFKHEDWQMRSRAAEVLGNIGDKRAVEPLSRALITRRDRNKYVRGRSAEALGKIGDERGIEPLIQALDDEYIYVRLKAEEALDNIKSEGKGSWIIHYENGEISFEYPNSWEIIETLDNTKIIKGSCANNALQFSINRHTDTEDISADEFAEMLRNVFIMQNIDIISEKGFKARNMDAYILTGENPHDVSMTKIMIVAFKKKDLLFYLWFAGEPNIFERANEDIDLIVDSFYIDN